MRHGAALLPLIGILLASAGAAQPVQQATASGACANAINVGAGATLTLNRNCYAVDAKTKAAVAALRRHDTIRQKDDDGRDRRIDQLEQTVAALLAASAKPAASEDDRKIGLLVENGDAKGAALLIGDQADRLLADSRRARQDAGDLYARQAVLLAGSDPQRALAAMDKAIATDPDDQQRLWAASTLAQDLGDQQRRIGYYQRLASLIAADLARRPKDTDLLYQSGLVASATGHALADAGGNADAVTSYQTALSRWRSLASGDPDNDDLKRDIADEDASLGMALLASGKPADAEAAFRRCQDRMGPLTLKQTDDDTWRREFAICNTGLGRVAEARHDWAAAREDYQTAFDYLGNDHTAAETAAMADEDEDIKTAMDGLARVDAATASASKQR